jgi:hypothetical protein
MTPIRALGKYCQDKNEHPSTQEMRNTLNTELNGLLKGWQRNAPGGVKKTNSTSNPNSSPGDKRNSGGNSSVNSRLSGTSLNSGVGRQLSPRGSPNAAPKDVDIRERVQSFLFLALYHENEDQEDIKKTNAANNINSSRDSGDAASSKSSKDSNSGDAAGPGSSKSSADSAASAGGLMSTARTTSLGTGGIITLPDNASETWTARKRTAFFVAQSMEEALYNAYLKKVPDHPAGQDYRTQARMLKSNIADKQNHQMRDTLIQAEVDLPLFVLQKAEDLAPESMKLERFKIATQSLLNVTVQTDNKSTMGSQFADTSSVANLQGYSDSMAPAYIPQQLRSPFAEDPALFQTPAYTCATPMAFVDESETGELLDRIRNY